MQTSHPVLAYIESWVAVCRPSLPLLFCALLKPLPHSSMTEREEEEKINALCKEFRSFYPVAAAW